MNKSKNKTVAILGGSFNPIHVGHLTLAQSALDFGLADEVWLMVSPVNPLKNNDDADFNERYSLVKKAVANRLGIVASDFENSLPRPSYTYLTLRALKEKFPDTDFRWMVGADNWNCFDKWACPEEILKQGLIVYPRPGFTVENLPENVAFLDAPMIDVSSTMIREKINKGEKVTGLVPVEIEEEIYGKYRTQH